MSIQNKAKMFHSNVLPAEARKVAKSAWLRGESRDTVLRRYQGFFRQLVEREWDATEQQEAAQ